MHFEAPKEEVAEDVNLISSGACGAFVHGFEDELQGKKESFVFICFNFLYFLFIIFSDENCDEKSKFVVRCLIWCIVFLLQNWVIAVVRVIVFLFE